MDSLHIFSEDSRFAQCHASTIARLSNGSLYAAWFGGTHEKHADVAIWGAVCVNGNWHRPVPLAKVRESAHWNPVLFAAPDGAIHLFFKVGDTIPQWETWHIVSHDDCVTWSDPVELVPGDRGGRGPVKNKPIVLSCGAWLAPASIETETSWDVFVDRSDDGGKTWVASDLLEIDRASNPHWGCIQPTLWESGPGQVHMLIRSSIGVVCRADSSDHGRTWSPIYPTEIPNNNSGLDVALLEDGALALVYNPVSGNWAERSPLSISLSYDNGLTWPRRLDIETEEGEFSYPAIIPVPGGMAVTYTWKRTCVAFWTGSPSDIPAV